MSTLRIFHKVSMQGGIAVAAMVLSAVFISCEDNTPLPVDPPVSEEVLLNDTVMYVSGPCTIEVDIDGDSAADVAFHVNYNQGQYYSNSIFQVVPLSSELKAPIQLENSYYDIDTTVCNPGNPGSDTFRYVFTKVNEPSDYTWTTDNIIQHDSLPETSVAFVTFTDTSIINKHDYTYHSPSGDCPESNRLLTIGNAISQQGDYFLFKKGGNTYAVKAYVVMPYLIVHSVKKL